MRKIIFALMVAAIVAPACLAAPKDKSASIKVISYNIRNGGDEKGYHSEDGLNSWMYRWPASIEMIKDQKPDIFGVQEAFDYQVKHFQEWLDDYKGFGVGREDGKHGGEHMDIFYNKKTIKVLKWGSFWLSETPDVPSLGWDAACKRTATWALMKDKKSGRKFYYVNTHLDHIGSKARENGLKLIVEKIAEINPDDLPMILTGDFNMTVDSPDLDGLKKIMKNARDVAVKTDHHGTYNGWGRASDDCIIDFIWFKGFSSCTEYETITKPYLERTFISDHFPIKATLIF